MAEKVYLAIDLKSFYASVECVSRGLDPLTTNLVVADPTRTQKTICLAVSPSLKKYGIAGRARLFEVVETVKAVNARRKAAAPNKTLNGSSCFAPELASDASKAVDYFVAPPRMAEYMRVSSQIYGIYTKVVSPDDIHVYSVDEVFIDATNYLHGTTPRAFAMRLILDVLNATGITATAGIGSNLYLAKIAMDIEAKHIAPDEYGVRIAELTEQTYRERLWEHRPITDFWRIGRGYAERLHAHGMDTMGDVALMSLKNEALLYRLFGINAELLIDHAWGAEPCTIAAIKSYKPEHNSIHSGQVLSVPADFTRGRLNVLEMTDLLVLDLVEKELVTDQITLAVCYDTENLTDPERKKAYHGETEFDRYGREVPKSAHGSARFPAPTSSGKELAREMAKLFDRIADKKLLIRRYYISAENVIRENDVKPVYEQPDLFADHEALARKREEEAVSREREKRQQKAVIAIHRKYGKNALLKGMNLEEGATTIERNGQVGGHKA